MREIELAISKAKDNPALCYALQHALQHTLQHALQHTLQHALQHTLQHTLETKVETSKACFQRGRVQIPRSQDLDPKSRFTLPRNMFCARVHVFIRTYSLHTYMFLRTWSEWHVHVCEADALPEHVLCAHKCSSEHVHSEICMYWIRTPIWSNPAPPLPYVYTHKICIYIYIYIYIYISIYIYTSCGFTTDGRTTWCDIYGCLCILTVMNEHIHAIYRFVYVYLYVSIYLSIYICNVRLHYRLANHRVR